MITKDKQENNLLHRIIPTGLIAADSIPVGNMNVGPSVVMWNNVCLRIPDPFHTICKNCSRLFEFTVHPGCSFKIKNPSLHNI